jgi:hypothetical protein
MKKIPWVRVTGDVNVENSVSVNVENGVEPVQVKVVPS